MKAYVEVEADVAKIADEIIEYVLHDNTINLYNGSPWKFLNTQKLFAVSPTLLDFFKQYKLVVKDSAITYITNKNDLPIHVDEKPVVAKMNFPVWNTKGWTNRWYSIDNLENYPKNKNQFGSEVYDLSTAKGTLLTEYRDMPNPIVFNSSIPHSVEQYADDAKSPRIIASFTFHKEPIEWLK